MVRAILGARESFRSCPSCYLEQELQYLYVAARLIKISSPGVETMLLHQESMSGRMPAEAFFNLSDEFVRILRVAYWQHLGVFVSSDAFQSFEHLVAFDLDRAICSVRL